MQWQQMLNAVATDATKYKCRRRQESGKCGQWSHIMNADNDNKLHMQKLTKKMNEGNNITMLVEAKVRNSAYE